MLLDMAVKNRASVAATHGNKKVSGLDLTPLFLMQVGPTVGDSCRE